MSKASAEIPVPPFGKGGGGGLKRPFQKAKLIPLAFASSETLLKARRRRADPQVAAGARRSLSHAFGVTVVLLIPFDERVKNGNDGRAQKDG